MTTRIRLNINIRLNTKWGRAAITCAILCIICNIGLHYCCFRLLKVLFCPQNRLLSENRIKAHKRGSTVKHVDWFIEKELGN